MADETGGNIKTQQADFQPEGRYPIIDQGKSLIAGYTDDPKRLCKARLPVIVFGDHTRSFKFVDFPFCLGADGTKILRPRINANEKYLFHYLSQIRIPNAGYDRHFKYLKRVEILLPPLDEQRQIASILDHADDIRQKRHLSLVRLDDLMRSTFLTLFGDPITNSSQWPQTTLQTFFRFRTGKLDSNAAVPSGQFPFFTCSREDFRIDTYAFDCEALLLAGNNANADYSVKYYKGKFNAYQRTYVITLCDVRNSYQYARFALEYRLAELKQISKGTNTKYLTLELLNNIRIPLPPPELQGKFADLVTAIENVKSANLIHLRKLDALLISLQHRAFGGDLTSKLVARELVMAG